MHNSNPNFDNNIYLNNNNNMNMNMNNFNMMNNNINNRGNNNMNNFNMINNNPQMNMNMSLNQVNPQISNLNFNNNNNKKNKIEEKENFSIMTKVQKKSIPILLKHRDVVVKSETGSGKTLAYVIPILDFLIAQNIKQKITRKDGVYVIVFAPTHELCLQIESTFDKLKSSCISAVFGSLMGGQSIETEKSRLRKADAKSNH